MNNKQITTLDSSDHKKKRTPRKVLLLLPFKVHQAHLQVYPNRLLSRCLSEVGRAFPWSTEHGENDTTLAEIITTPNLELHSFVASKEILQKVEDGFYDTVYDMASFVGYDTTSHIRLMEEIYETGKVKNEEDFDFRWVDSVMLKNEIAIKYENAVSLYNDWRLHSILNDPRFLRILEEVIQMEPLLKGHINFQKHYHFVPEVLLRKNLSEEKGALELSSVLTSVYLPKNSLLVRQPAGKLGSDLTCFTSKHERNAEFLSMVSDLLDESVGKQVEIEEEMEDIDHQIALAKQEYEEKMSRLSSKREDAEKRHRHVSKEKDQWEALQLPTPVK